MDSDEDGQAALRTVDLHRYECLELLQHVSMGRVVLSVDCIPVALPVNLCLLGEDIMFLTDAGSKLDAAVRASVVTVEVDDIDPVYRTGWSVLVTGRAEIVGDAVAQAAADTHLMPWAPGPHPYLIRVPSTLISGRQIMWTTVSSTVERR